MNKCDFIKNEKRNNYKLCDIKRKIIIIIK